MGLFLNIIQIRLISLVRSGLKWQMLSILLSCKFKLGIYQCKTSRVGKEGTTLEKNDLVHFPIDLNALVGCTSRKVFHSFRWFCCVS